MASSSEDPFGGKIAEPIIERKEFSYTRISITGDSSDAVVDLADSEIDKLQRAGKSITRHIYVIVYQDTTTK